MKTKAILVLLCATLVLGIASVSAYNFVLDRSVVLHGTTFAIDNILFRNQGGDIQVRLDSSWFTICPESYSVSGSYVTMLDDVVCNPLASGGPLCSEAGGGCGGS